MSLHSARDETRDETSHPSIHTMEAHKMAQRTAVKAGMTTCAHCQKSWGGLKTAHCTGCHETFTVTSAFDKHRDGSHANDTRRCVPPESVGLVNAGRAYPCWGFASNGTDHWDDDTDDAA